jgi:hypothetical protein
MRLCRAHLTDGYGIRSWAFGDRFLLAVWADILLIRLWLLVRTPGGGEVKRIDVIAIGMRLGQAHQQMGSQAEKILFPS